MRRLRSSPLLRNILAVASGAAAGQAVTFAFSPLITRIYSPEVFGLQGVFLSLISILSPVIALRYPMAIITAENETDAGRMARLSLVVAFAISCLLGLVLLVAQGPVLQLVGAEALGALIWLLPVALFCVALQDIANFQAARADQFRLVGVVTVAQAFLTNLARVLGGLVAPVAGMLVAVTSITPSVQAALLTIGDRRPRQPRPTLTRSDAVELLRRHRDFPLYRVPTDVLNALAQTSPVFILSILYSSSVVGYYVLARSVVNLPLAVIGGAVGNVYYSRFAASAREGAILFPLVLKGTLFHMLLVGVPLLLAALLFPPMFSVIFGEIWRPAGEYAQWMVLWVVGMVSNIPTVRALPVIGRQDIHLVFNTSIMVGGIGAMFLGFHLFGTPYAAVMWYSIATAILYGLQIVTYLSLVRRYDRKLWQ